MESRTQGSRQEHKKNPRPRTALPRTDPLEAKDRNARGQEPRTQAQVLSKKKRSSKKIFRRSQEKTVFQKIFQALHKLFTTQKIVLSSSRVRGNFQGLDVRGQGHQIVSSKTPPLVTRSVALLRMVAPGAGFRGGALFRSKNR